MGFGGAGQRRPACLSVRVGLAVRKADNYKRKDKKRYLDHDEDIMGIG